MNMKRRSDVVETGINRHEFTSCRQIQSPGTWEHLGQFSPGSAGCCVAKSVPVWAVLKSSPTGECTTQHERQTRCGVKDDRRPACLTLSLGRESRIWGWKQLPFPFKLRLVLTLFKDQ
jgi:hypothetical protein